MVQQYHGNKNTPAKSQDGHLVMTTGATGGSPAALQTTSSTSGARVCSDYSGMVSRGGLSDFEAVTSFHASQPGAMSVTHQTGSVSAKKRPPTPPPKPENRATKTANCSDNRITTAVNCSDNRTTKAVNFKDDLDVATTNISTNIATHTEGIPLHVQNWQLRKPLSEMDTNPTAHDSVDSAAPATASVKAIGANTARSQMLENSEATTKFPNSFVASRRQQTVSRTAARSPSHHISQTSVLSNSSDSSSGNAKASIVYDAEEAVTSFKKLDTMEAGPSLPFNRSLGHKFARSSTGSTTSSASSHSSRSSVLSASSPLFLKMYSGSPNRHSPVLLSPSISSLSSSSSHGISSLDVSSASFLLPEVPSAGVIPEVPEYDEVNASSCDSCSEGKCRTVYLQLPELPFGWEKVEDPHYGVYYIDHVNRRTQYDNPLNTLTKDSAGDEVTNTFPRHKKTSDTVTKRSASENNMHGQLCPTTGRPFFTKEPGELKGEFQQTSLVKSARGLGFTIIGGHLRDSQLLQIKNVVENGPAHLSGKFRSGDVIVRVNNICVLGFTHQDVVRLFQSIAPGETVYLETCRGYPLNFDPNDPNTEIVTTVAVTLPQNAGTFNSQSHATNNEGTDAHMLRVGLKSLPDLTRSVVGHGQNPASTLYLSNCHEEAAMNTMRHQHVAIPDLVSLSIHERPEILTIPIVKGPVGFGFTIADSPYGQRVKQILDQSRCQNLAEGDLLVQIDSVGVRELPHQQTVQMLKDCRQDQETVIVVQRRGIPPPTGRLNNQVAMAHNLSDMQQQIDNGSVAPGTYFFHIQGHNFNAHEQLHNHCAGMNGVHGDSDNPAVPSSMLPPPIEEADEETEDAEGEKLQNKTSAQDSQRPKTPQEGNNTMPPANKTGSPRLQPYMDMQVGRRDYQDCNDFSKVNNSRPDAEGNSMGRPPRGPCRPDYFPRFDTRLRNGNSRSDPFQQQFSSMPTHAGSGDERWGHGREVKPGQFRSRTPGPELMARGGAGPDSSRPEVHRPKTPTAADMRTNGKPLTSFGTGDFKASGRFTPNPSSEQGRQYRSPYHDHNRNWQDFSPPIYPTYEPFESSSLTRNFAGDFPKTAFQNSVGSGRPLKQSTSFESDKPVPSTITRVPRKPPAHPSFQGLLQRSQGRIITDENGAQVMEMLVTLHRQESGYGFRIIGGTEESSQVSVGHIVPGGAADVDGRLRQNDEITHVDGCSVLNASHHRVVELMTNAALNGRVTLSIKRVLATDSKTNESIIPQYPFDVVVSRRENEGFGFVIISSVNKSGASVNEIIGHIQDNSPAARCGRLHVGDRILAVNGIDTSNMHHKDVVSLIKDSGFSVALTIGQPPDDHSSSPQKSCPGLAVTSSNYTVDKPDMNIQSWERNQPGLSRDVSRPKAPSNKSPDDNGDLYQVELNRGSRGFGFSIRGGREFNAMPLYVLRIAEGGAADLDGRLRVGDQILEINNFITENMTHTEAIEIIQNGGLNVKLLMHRTNKPPPLFEGPPASPSSLPSGAAFLPNIPPVANGPISHSSPHMARRQLQHQQTLPPPPPELQQPSNDSFQNYPPPPYMTQATLPQQQQRQRFNNY